MRSLTVLLSLTSLVACGSKTQPPGPAACPDCPAIDLDGDGAPAAPCGLDCDDGDPGRHPGAPDPDGDGVDTNCDGADGTDVDGDGFQDAEIGGDDCDDLRATVHPGANDNEGWVLEDTGFPGANMQVLAVNRFGQSSLAGTDGDTCTNEYEVDCDHEGGRVAYFATLVGGAWRVAAVEEGRIFPSIGIAATGAREFLVSYPFAEDGLTGTMGSIHVARCSGDGCSAEAPIASAEAARGQQGTDIAVDSCGRTFLAYSSVEKPPGEDWIPLAVVGSDDDGQWLEERVGELEWRWQDLEVRAGAQYVAFETAGRDPQYGHRSVALAHRGPTGWTVEELAVHPTLADGGDVALAIDLAGRPIVGYWGQEGLWLLQPSAEPSRVTDSPGFHRFGLAVDSGGVLHVLFSEDRRAIYATNRTGEWVTEDLGPGGEFSSVAVDGDDVVHVSFSPGMYGTHQLVDGADQNCDGVDGVDLDHDGHASVATGGDDADDADPDR